MLLEIVSYIVTVSLATIIPPFTAVPLELAAASRYGAALSYIYTVSGNVLGSLVAFWVGRRFGWKLINLLFDGKRIKKAKNISQKYTFWQITLSRMAFSSVWDVLSFACGLTKMTARQYILSSIISTLPSTAMIVLFGNRIDLNFAFTAWTSAGIFAIALYIMLKRFLKVSKK